MLILLALAALPAFAQKRAPVTGLCSVRNLPTEVPSDFKTLSIKSHSFFAGPNSTAELRIQNLSPKPVIAMRLVLEYYGTNRERFGDAIAQGIAKGLPKDQVVSIGKRMDRGGFGSEGMRRAVLPGDTVSLDGPGWFATAACPARAKLTAASLWFSDGTSLDWSTPDSRIDPESNDLHLRDLPACLVQHKMDRLFLSLDLDAAGRVLKAHVSLPEASRTVPCDAGEIADWKFEPALLGGKPVGTHLQILLRVFGKSSAAKAGDLPVSHREASHPVVILDAFAPGRTGDPWRLVYADALTQVPNAH